MVGVSSSSHFVSKIFESISSFRQSFLGKKPADLQVGKEGDFTYHKHVHIASVLLAFTALSGLAITAKDNVQTPATKEKQSAGKRKGDISLGAQKGRGTGGQGSAYQLPPMSQGSGSALPEDRQPRGGSAKGISAHYKQTGKLPSIHAKPLPGMKYAKPGSTGSGQRGQEQ